MSREKQRRIASKGGQIAHERGVAHQFTSAEAREAGKKGGAIISRNREHMAAIGKKGGEVSRSSRRNAQLQKQQQQQTTPPAPDTDNKSTSEE
ncbi:stress-induced protein [Chitinophaga sp. MD30]|nr:KGG domain-containing protein [Chitinophaga sp. MD30]ASZ13821.1 stress-induced protein [Chitinophaga sp. MD30]